MWILLDQFSFSLTELEGNRLKLFLGENVKHKCLELRDVSRKAAAVSSLNFNVIVIKPRKNVF